MAAMAEAAAQSQYVDLKDAGHIIAVNAPEAFNEAIAEFLDL